MSKSYSMAEARENFTRVVHEAEEGERVELTRRGRPVVILMSLPEPGRIADAKPSFWEAYEAFRGRYEGSDVDVDDVFEGLRESSPRRHFEW